jgi:tetratricopeptide (TPR) repeat protein
VEAVIEERIHRLDPELREILRIASVEGRIFTAQVVARVQDIHERHLLKRLSLDLEKRHRLVQEAGEHRVDSLSLSRYRFVHHLFQRYLYNNFCAGERKLLHGAVGDILSEFYADREEDIVVQLAYHYQQAGNEEKALPYLIRAGHQARVKFAHDEAVRYYTEALSILLQDSPELFELLASRAAVFGIVARRNEQRADIERMLDLAEKLADDTLICDALLALANYNSETKHLDAQQPGQDALVIARKLRDPLREGQALRCLGTLEMRKGDNHRSKDQLAAAADIFLEVGASREAAACLHQLSVTLVRLGEHEPAIEAAKKAVALSREIGDQQQEATGARRVASAYTVHKQHAEALPFARRALALHQEVGDRSSECAALNVIGIIRTHQGKYADSEKHLRKSLKIAESIGSSQHTAYAAFNLVRLHYERLGDFEGCLQFLSTLLEKAKIEGDDWVEAFFCDEKGRILMHLGQYDRAYRYLSTASRMMEELGDLWLGLPSSIWNGLVQAYLGDYEGAVDTLRLTAERARVARLDFESAMALVVLGLVYLLDGRFEVQHTGLERVLEGLDLMPDADVLHSWCGIGYEIAAALYLKLGVTDKAMQYSIQGLKMMESDPSPWWSERRHYTHSLILRAAGQEVDADEHLKLAYARVMMVADNTKDQRLRRSWLENVDVNREIFSACVQRRISHV